MQVTNPLVLKSIFALKGNFAPGVVPVPKKFSGVEITPYKNDAKAAICISGDLELAWAWRGRNEELVTSRATTERKNVPAILSLLEQTNIPVTWATVGHLFLSSCERSGTGLAHADMPRPARNDRWDGDWYMHDPCSDSSNAPSWYAPDLIRQIIDSKIPHEIGTHTFSHINFSPLSCTTDLVRRELEACISAMEEMAVVPKSLVFPHNVVSYVNEGVLADLGVIAVRHRDERVRLSYPERTPHGLYKLYESMNLRRAKYYDYADKADIFIKEAIDRRAAFCIWFHPSDPIELFYNQFLPILEFVSYQRSIGEVWVATMRDVAAYCEARECLNLQVIEEGNAIKICIESSLDVSRYGTPEVTLRMQLHRRPDCVSLECGGSKVARVPFNYSPRSSALLINIPVTARAVRFTFDS